MPSAITASCANSLTEDVPAPQQDNGRPGAGRHLDEEVTDKLTDDGVKLFADAFDKLLAAVEKSTQQKG